MEVKDLTIKVGKEELLKNVSFTLIPGQLNLIIGKNGVGKTLLLDELSCLDKRSSALQGFPARSDIIYQTQGVPFISEATVEQTLTLIGDLTHSSDRLLKNIPPMIANHLPRKFGKLSSGERRFLIIWAILNVDKELYLLDEPFANLDLSTIKKVMTLFYEKVSEGKTIVATTHQFDFLDRDKTHIIVLKEGQVIFENSLAAFYAYYSDFQALFDEYL
ncbi:ATP-binding protein [Streptococcus gallolyticus]|uniref:ATP-binding protein n=1 Tax=Streptococcus gallolyticus TaxID=315405 RepID=A0A368UB42_9STRE|nr:AAA family ATPase [Streptococcus gallolyticus]RCW16221.1 ATP-binding protein [Streptococcus gallolyticus]